MESESYWNGGDKESPQKNYLLILTSLSSFGFASSHLLHIPQLSPIFNIWNPTSPLHMWRYIAYNSVYTENNSKSSIKMIDNDLWFTKVFICISTKACKLINEKFGSWNKKHLQCHFFFVSASFQLLSRTHLGLKMEQ